MAGRFFISYSREDAEAAHAIASDLRDLGKDIWLDRQLTGGQQWWDAILERIRTCDVFVIVLSETSLRSKACRSELDYAHQLQRRILPVAAGPLIDALMPPHLANIQRIPAGDVRQLARALMDMGTSPALPDPLPTPPPVPISYLDQLADSLDAPLPLSEQRNLLGTLRHLLQVGEERAAALELLTRLRQHPDVNAWVAAEIDADLARERQEPAHRQPPPAVGAPSPPRGTQRPASHQSYPAQPGGAPISLPPRPGIRPGKSNGPVIAIGVTVVVVLLLGVVGCVALLSSTDEPNLDAFRSDCDAGDMAACDDLYRESPVGSADELFGATCGNRTAEAFDGACEVNFG